MARRFTYAEKGKAISNHATKAPPLRIRAPEIDTTQAIRDNQLTLIGRLTNPKEQKIWRLIPFLSRRWSAKGTVTCSDLGQSCFQVRFESKDDLDYVLAHRPYHYARWMVIIQQWEPIISPEFPSLIPFWIELKGLPLHYWKKEMLHKIGREIGQLDGFEVTPLVAKIRVTIDGLKPLIKETIVEFDSGDETIVSLEYEKLANHCQLCNSLLHDEQQCQNQSDQESYHQEPPTTDNEVKKTQRQHPESPRLPRNHSTIPSSGQMDGLVMRKQGAYSERLDRHGRPFGVRPSAKTPTNPYRRKTTTKSPNHNQEKGKQPEKTESPNDSHSYRRNGRDPQRHRNDPKDRRTHTNLIDDSRRRSLSYGIESIGGQRIWREKSPLVTEDHINTPFTTPAQHSQNSAQEVQQMHENIMTELQEVTLQYINVPDPVESAARRQRVLDGETQDLMAKTAATLLESAMTKANNKASNHAFYAALEANNDPINLPEGQENPEVPSPGLAASTQPIQPRKRGRPPGRSASKVNQQTLRGAGSKKRKVLIQNSPLVRKSYSTQNNTEGQKGTKRTTQRKIPHVTRPPRSNTPAMKATGKEPGASLPGTSKMRKNSQGRGTKPKSPMADFHNPPSSLP
ncbi:uncharacterized protein LOC106453421 [Brassica napus]|uniref:uncharacterized protein LOC106453421 n=1 Tax=Brassica napus TaxID=3708 RepID=UPI002078A215|nr:uncharacterized protein LOC106453421 [Brassica napus]